jgi:hypothetical protein
VSTLGFNFALLENPNVQRQRVGSFSKNHDSASFGDKSVSPKRESLCETPGWNQMANGNTKVGFTKKGDQSFANAKETKDLWVDSQYDLFCLLWDLNLHALKH